MAVTSPISVMGEFTKYVDGDAKAPEANGAVELVHRPNRSYDTRCRRPRTKLRPIVTNIPSAEDVSIPKVKTSVAEREATDVANIEAAGSGQPLPSVSNVALPKVTFAVNELRGSVFCCEGGLSLSAPAFRRSAIRSEGRSEGGLSLSPSAFRGTAVCCEGGLSLSAPAFRRSAIRSEGRSEGGLSLSPSAFRGTAVCCEGGLSLSAPATLRASPQAARRASASCPLLPELPDSARPDAAPASCWAPSAASEAPAWAAAAWAPSWVARAADERRIARFASARRARDTAFLGGSGSDRRRGRQLTVPAVVPANEAATRSGAPPSRRPPVGTARWPAPVAAACAPGGPSTRGAQVPTGCMVPAPHPTAC